MDERDLSRRSDELLRGAPQNSEFPFVSDSAERRRRRGRGQGDQYRQVALDELVHALDARPDEQVGRLDSVQELLGAAGLSGPERAVVAAYSTTELTLEEIGVYFLDRSEATVKRYLASARRKLARAIQSDSRLRRLAA